MKKLDQEIFLKRAIKIHNNYYDYSLVKYKNNRTKIKVICPIHGVFEVLPQVHLRGSKCKLCVNNNIKLTTNDFIEKANQIHNKKYDYSLVEYENNMKKIKIICPEHGIFQQTPNSHLSGKGCIKCVGLNKLTTIEFIINSKKVHHDKYDYSLSDYKNNRKKLKIICPEHGIFEQKPINHIILKQGCPVCGGTKKLEIDNFIKRSNLIHNNFYDYSEVKYVNFKTKIDIICPIHGKFKQTPHSHLQKNGCPVCRESKGEKIIRKFLITNKIKYEKNKTFDNCRYKRRLRFDFYLINENCVIEFDGYQHFNSYDFFGGEKDFEIRKIRDELKNKYCKENNIKLIRLNNLKTINTSLKKELKIDG